MEIQTKNMGVSKMSPNNSLFTTLPPFQLAKIASIEKTKRLLSVLAISLPGSKSLSISMMELLIKLNEKENNITNKNIFHH
jgi:hypothetical protein